MAYLTTTNGPQAGRRYELKQSVCVMGRHPDCQVVVDVGAVSRHHAQIVVVGTEFFVEDLKSRNGTYLNDNLIQGRSPLSNGDTVRVCDVEFRFHNEAFSASSASDALTGSGSSSGVKGTVLFDDELQDSSSTIMSKLDISSNKGRVQLTASPEAKLNALIEITRNMGKCLKLDEVLPGVLESLFKVFVQADRGFIVMRNAKDELIPMWTKSRREDEDDTIRISRTIVRQVMESREAILSADAASDARFEMSQSIADFRIRSMMCAPLLDSEGVALGVLQVDTLDQRKRFQQEDLEVLASVATQAGVAIDNAQLHENALHQLEIQRDLEVAREVQKGFLPDTPPQLDGYEFYNYYEPANHVGGDYFDYIPLPDGRVAVIVADVVGHGIAAALLMAKMSAEARFCLASEPRVDIAVNRLNDAMSGLQIDRFVTMIMVVLDPKTHEVTVVNAGHMAPLRRLQDGTLEEPGEDIAGLPVGITDGMEYEVLKFTLGQGEMLVLYTDGVNECMNEAGDMYGIDRMREQVTALKDASPAELGQAIMNDVLQYQGNATQFDDMCLVCFKRT